MPAQGLSCRLGREAPREPVSARTAPPRLAPTLGPTLSALRAFAFAPARAAAVLALLALSACQDPSTVGLGLIDDEASNPNVRVLAATTAEASAFSLVTSGVASTDSQARVLVGDVRDALYGDAAAVANVDAVAPTLPSGFAERPVTRVTLELRRDYVYGDTTAAVPVELRRITGQWTPDGLPTETTLTTGDLIATASLSARDSLAIIALPAAWVAANGGVFASTSFGTDFEGFELRAAGRAGDGAVLGYNVASSASVIRVATSRDTVAFRLSEVFTSLRRGVPALTPPGRRLLRGGTGTGLRLSFDYASALRLPLAQAVFRLPLDRSLAGATGAFKRPLAREVALFAIPTTGEPLRTAILTTGTRGDARSSAATQAAGVFNVFVQNLLLERATYPSFEVRLPTNPVSLDVLPVVTDGAVPTARPRLSLTVVGQ